MSTKPAPSVDQSVYWNEHGGQRWVANIDRTEAMLTPLNNALLGVAKAAPNETVLDIGCGGGVTSHAFALAVGQSGSVLGLDISEVILNVARERYRDISNLEFETADAATKVFSEAQFDLIASRFGVMFFPDPTAAFTNLHRGLKADGRLVFICWRKLEENPWLGRAAQAAFEIITPPPRPGPDDPGPFSFADPERVDPILTSAGFSNIVRRPIDQDLEIGPLKAAAAHLTRMGPAGAALENATDAERAAVTTAIESALVEYEVDGVVRMPSATWIVSARA